MKVLHVIPNLSPNQGGLRTALWSTVASQCTVGIEPEVAVVGQTTASQPVPLHCFTRSGFGPFATSRDMRRWLLDNASRFDAIIAHSVWLSPTRYAALAARRAGIPLFLVPHGMLDPDALAHHAFRKWLRWNTGERRVLKDSTLVFSTLEDASRALGHPQLSGAKHVVIPNAIDTSKPMPDGNPDDPPLILCLNRLHPRKGALELAQAIRKLAETGLSFSAVFAGPVEDNDYETRCKLELAAIGDHVKFIGNQPAAEVAKLLSKASVLVHPCIGFENFGMVIIEGILAGVPVVASRRALVTPQLEKAGAVIGVDPNPTDLAKALANVLSGAKPDPIQALDHVRCSFGLKAVGNVWKKALKLYTTVADE